MNLSPAAAAPAGMISEPPLSPGAAPSPPPVAPAPSLEAQVVRIGLMSPAAVESTLQAEAETGRPFAELAVEHGHVDAAHMSRLTEVPPAAEAKEPEPAEEPEPEREPAAVATPAPLAEAGLVPAEPAASLEAHVFVRLANGERIAAGAYTGEKPAEERARELMRALSGDGEWPCIDGRYIRPDAVVSIDVELPSA
jgi:hypothetical protein